MDHQKFKSWILEDETLSEEEESLLKEHLAHCADCAQLKANLEAALQVVRTAPEIAAPPIFTALHGFTRRPKTRGGKTTGAGLNARSRFFSSRYRDRRAVNLPTGNLTHFTRSRFCHLNAHFFGCCPNGRIFRQQPH